MEQQIHQYHLLLDWELLNAINKVDRFDAKWETIEKKEGQSLAQLKNLAIVKNIGATARIKGGYYNDKDVEVLLKKKNRYVIRDPLAQEVLGHYEVVKSIADRSFDLDLSEQTIKNFHNNLLKYKESEHWTRGNYRLQAKPVETALQKSTNASGFKTTRPTFVIEKSMSALLSWYQEEQQVHPLVKVAVFVYEFLAINPFDKGNESMARILASFLLLKADYRWLQYVSLEQEIELRQTEYARILRRCQAKRPQEDIGTWVLFFLDLLGDLQSQLMQKLKKTGTVAQLAPKLKAILLYIETHPGCRSGHVASRLGIANSTAKRLLKDLLEQDLIQRYGSGAGTNYTIG